MSTFFPIEPTDDAKTTHEPVDVRALLAELRSSVSRDGGCIKVKTVLTVPQVDQIIERAKKVFSGQPMCVEFEPAVIICGDIHGQFTDLLRIFDKCGYPPDKKYLFLGDYVDRGPFSLETICLLLLLKIEHPESIYLLRGNHECSAVNRAYGFYAELNKRFKEPSGITLWFNFQDVFNWLPLTAIVGERLLCMHGGISQHLTSKDQLLSIQRPIDPCEPGLPIDLLWADPDSGMGNASGDPNWVKSSRGISYHFSRKCLVEFCDTLNIDMVVRAHQVVQDGYEFFANRRCLTLFSAPNYCGEFNNQGAVMHIDNDMKCTIEQFPPDPMAIKVAPKRVSEVTIGDLDDLIPDDEASKSDSEKASPSVNENTPPKATPPKVAKKPSKGSLERLEKQDLELLSESYPPPPPKGEQYKMSTMAIPEEEKEVSLEFDMLQGQAPTKPEPLVFCLCKKDQPQRKHKHDCPKEMVLKESVDQPKRFSKEIPDEKPKEMPQPKPVEKKPIDEKTRKKMNKYSYSFKKKPAPPPPAPPPPPVKAVAVDDADFA